MRMDRVRRIASTGSYAPSGGHSYRGGLPTGRVRNPKGVGIVRPRRCDLTKRQWEEYGELRRRLALIGYYGFEKLSLKDLRDAAMSMSVCQRSRLIANQAA
jgi:hypothetical protein